MVLLLLILISLILTFLFIFSIAIIVGEKLIVFLVKLYMSDDEIYQMYNLAMTTLLFCTMFILTAATYNTFIK
jgi:hypothetical protein